MFKINPGELKHTIQISTPDSGTDQDGIPLSTYTVLLSTKAKIVNVNGTKVILADGISATNIKKFYIRYKKVEITSKDKIIYKDKSYDIKYINNIEEQHKYLEITAELVE